MQPRHASKCCTNDGVIARPAVERRLHQIDAAARRIHLLAPQHVGRTARQTESAVHALVDQCGLRRVDGIEGGFDHFLTFPSRGVFHRSLSIMRPVRHVQPDATTNTHKKSSIFDFVTSCFCIRDRVPASIQHASGIERPLDRAEKRLVVARRAPHVDLLLHARIRAQHDDVTDDVGSCAQSLDRGGDGRRAPPRCESARRRRRRAPPVASTDRRRAQSRSGATASARRFAGSQLARTMAPAAAHRPRVWPRHTSASAAPVDQRERVGGDQAPQLVDLRVDRGLRGRELNEQFDTARSG